MNLYLIRHADALALGERGITEDAERPLSEQGENQSQQLARALQKRGVTIATLVTSPLLRAKQTADWMLRAWSGTHPEIQVCEDLAPDGKTRKLARFLRGLTAENIAIVGHIPQIAEFAGWLIRGKKAQIDMAKAGAALIMCGDGPRKGNGTLEWLVTPAWCE